MLLFPWVDALKICDFGLATLFRSQTTKEERKLTTYCGTAPYSSPEVTFMIWRIFLIKSLS